MGGWDYLRFLITHKQFANEHTWSMDLCGRPLTINMGKVAELATASALVTYGETCRRPGR